MRGLRSVTLLALSAGSCRVRHPNIVQVHDAGEVDGRPYFTMELVEGGDLADQVQGVPQSACKAAGLVATIADAVHTRTRAGSSIVI